MSRLLHLLADRITHGELLLWTPDGRRRRHRGDQPGPTVRVRVHDPHLGSHLVRGGAAALGSAWVDGAWDTDDLAATLRVLSTAVDSHVRSELGQRLQAAAGRAFDAVLATVGTDGAVDTMADHYDLGNDFYAAWLDETMTYSSALFGRPTDGREVGAAAATARAAATAMTPAAPVSRAQLALAQRAKYDRLLDDLGVGEGDRVLEIGFGWGGFAEAATARGAHVTGVTISREQHEYAAKRMARLGRAHLVDFHLVDFARIPEVFGDDAFDAVVSIEMIESVPRDRWAGLFEVTAGALRPGGRAAYQVIVIADDLFETYARRQDFITTWIFPGGRLPSPAVVGDLSARAGLSAIDVVGFGPSYAATLATWWREFRTAMATLRGMGFDERFERMWHYYLAYCQVGFELGRIDVQQWTWQRQA